MRTGPPCLFVFTMRNSSRFPKNSPLWHPCTQMKDHGRFPPIPIVRGKGVYLYDARGRRLLDGISSWWVNLFGPSHPRLVKVLSRQASRLEQVIFAGFTHDAAEAFAAALISVVPKGLTRLFLADNGSSAIEAALKMSFQSARQSGRTVDTFIALSGG